MCVLKVDQDMTNTIYIHKRCWLLEFRISEGQYNHSILAVRIASAYNRHLKILHCWCGDSSGLYTVMMLSVNVVFFLKNIESSVGMQKYCMSVCLYLLLLGYTTLNTWSFYHSKWRYLILPWYLAIWLAKNSQTGK